MTSGGTSGGTAHTEPGEAHASPAESSSPPHAAGRWKRRMELRATSAEAEASAAAAGGVVDGGGDGLEAPGLFDTGTPIDSRVLLGAFN